MNRKLTKDALQKFQSQVLFHFSRSDNTEERATLLELIQVLERAALAIQEDTESKGKSPFAGDPTSIVAALAKRKGGITTVPPYPLLETVERLLLKEACR